MNVSGFQASAKVFCPMPDVETYRLRLWNIKGIRRKDG